MSICPNFERLEEAVQPLDGQAEQLRSYRVALPHEELDEHGQVLDWVIGFALDDLGARHLDLRIVEAAAPLVQLDRARVRVLHGLR